MSVTFKEVKGQLCIDDCVALHKKIFNLSEIDAFPPSFFSMLLREEHPLGYVYVCFDGKAMVGIATLIADLNKESSLYVPFVGVLPEYRNTRTGYQLVKYLRDESGRKGYQYLFGLFDPLELNLAKLYFHMGARCTTYICQPYKVSGADNAQLDKLVFECPLNSSSNTYDSGASKIKSKQFDNPMDVNTVLVEVPEKFKEMACDSVALAKEWRLRTRNELLHYVNGLKYAITGMVTKKTNDERKYFYLLEKNEPN